MRKKLFFMMLASCMTFNMFAGNPIKKLNKTSWIDCDSIAITFDSDTVWIDDVKAGEGTGYLYKTFSKEDNVLNIEEIVPEGIIDASELTIKFISVTKNKILCRINGDLIELKQYNNKYYKHY